MTPSFEEFAQFIRDWGRFKSDRSITPNTLFEDDPGITGDDGADLLEAVERRFKAPLRSAEHGYRKTFDLSPNEVLFQSEGWWPTRASVRAFTVGQLYDAVKRVANQNRSQVDPNSR